MPPQPRAIQTRKLLVQAAAESFAHEGFERVGVNQISRRAGVSTGALHFHFASKRDLAQAVEEKAAAAVTTLADAGLHGSEPALRRLVDSTYAFGRLTREDPSVRAALRLRGERSWTRPGQEPGVHDTWERFVQAMLEQAAAENSVADPDADGVAARAYAAAVLGHQLITGNSHEQLVRLCALLVWGLTRGRPPA